jgi:hypothetical protein
MGINPFDDDNGNHFVLANGYEQHACGRRSPMFQTAGGWFTAKRPVLCVWTISDSTGPMCGRRVCTRRWQRGRAIHR